MKICKIIYYYDTGKMEEVNNNVCPISKRRHNMDTSCILLNNRNAHVALCDDGNIKCICRKGGPINESDADKFCKLLQHEIDLYNFAVQAKQRES